MTAILQSATLADCAATVYEVDSQPTVHLVIRDLRPAFTGDNTEFFLTPAKAEALRTVLDAVLNP